MGRYNYEVYEVYGNQKLISRRRLSPRLLFDVPQFIQLIFDVICYYATRNGIASNDCPRKKKDYVANLDKEITVGFNYGDQGVMMMQVSVITTRREMYMAAQQYLSTNTTQLPYIVESSISQTTSTVYEAEFALPIPGEPEGEKCPSKPVTYYQADEEQCRAYAAKTSATFSVAKTYQSFSSCAKIDNSNHWMYSRYTDQAIGCPLGHTCLCVLESTPLSPPPLPPEPPPHLQSPMLWAVPIALAVLALGMCIAEPIRVTLQKESVTVVDEVGTKMHA